MGQGFTPTALGMRFWAGKGLKAHGLHFLALCSAWFGRGRPLRDPEKQRIAKKAHAGCSCRAFLAAFMVAPA